MPIHTDLIRDARVLDFTPCDLIEAMSYEVSLCPKVSGGLVWGVCTLGLRNDCVEEFSGGLLFHFYYKN